MPRKYAKKRRRTKKGSMSRIKLLDSRINTIYEKRAQEIARTEAKKSRVRCILRQMIWGAYSYATNEFSDPVTVDYFGPDVREIGPVPMNFGVNANVQGSRLGNNIKVTGFSLDMKCRLPENQSIVTRRATTVNYRIFGVYDDWQDTSPPADPDMDESIKWYRFAYTPLIDNQPDPIDNQRRHRTFVKGSLTLRNHDAYPVERSVRKYVSLKTPLLVQYGTTTALRDVPKRWRFYFAVRSNIPMSAGSDLKANIWVSTKLHYFQP